VTYPITIAKRHPVECSAINGVTFDDAWSSRVKTKLAGHSIHVIGRRELIRNKRASGRTKDLVDLEILEEGPA